MLRKTIFTLPCRIVQPSSLYQKVVLLGTTKENASEFHRSASALNSKDNNGIGNIYHALSRFFFCKTLTQCKVMHLKFCTPLSLLFMVDPVRSLSSASYRKSGSMSNG